MIEKYKGYLSEKGNITNKLIQEEAGLSKEDLKAKLIQEEAG